MLLDKLKVVAYDLLSKYFDEVHKNDLQANIDKQKGVLLYPTLLLIIKTDRQYILELFGASRSHNGLKVRALNCDTSINYLYQFHAMNNNSIVNFNAENNSLENIIFSNIDDENPSFVVELFKENKYPQIMRESGDGSLINFGDQFKSCALFNCVIRNKFDSFIRVKYILAMIIIDKRMSQVQFKKTLNDFLEKPFTERRVSLGIRGVSLLNSQDSISHILLANFQNLYLVNTIKETMITSFLAEHPEILQQAFKAKKIMAERNFRWQEPQEETTIRPDFLVQRADGYWDIVDFKLPLREIEDL